MYGHCDYFNFGFKVTLSKIEMFSRQTDNARHTFFYLEVTLIKVVMERFFLMKMHKRYVKQIIINAKKQHVNKTRKNK